MSKVTTGQNPWALSDRIDALIARFEEHHDGVTMNGEGVTWMIGELVNLRLMASVMANEISRCRWNEAAMADNTAAVLAALKSEGSNIALFPVIPRPITDGRTS